MPVHSLEEMDSFKYSDLQNLAKSLGLRANLRADKLLKALKAHIQQEARKEQGNQDAGQPSASSWDENEVQSTDREQTERCAPQTKRRGRAVKGTSDSQQDHSELGKDDPTGFQNQEQENQDPETVADVPSLPNEGPGAGNAVSMGRGRKHERRKSRYAHGVSKAGKNKKSGSTTPNFKKLHEAHFKEMESIDQYIERKRKHFEEHNNTLNELKQALHKGAVVTPTVTPVPLRKRPSVASTPASQRRSPRPSQDTASRSILWPKRSVRSSTHSATKMNVRFSAATEDNEHKRSLTKTPARKSPHVTISGSAPKGPAELGTRTVKTSKVDSAAVMTPFKLATEAIQTPVSSRKPVFDLKASLSRPLNYEPHKGKLKPWGQTKENTSLSEPVSRVSFYKKTYKQPHLQTREEQRKKHEQERREKKAKVLGARRGLTVVAV
ncbi:nucleolar and spindle-associated protein 1 [Echinops telfairi]|uniref:Nucleolar and spindle-associated protein 1 n=1 Tax=Echinops telfairi TaxID=9371 RepID=A0AC55CWP3_ECHTE|nr:nucleolar and spindle-associated protein 1 [Echinops telfairi]